MAFATSRAALTGLRKRGFAVALARSDKERGSIYRIEKDPNDRVAVAPPTEAGEPNGIASASVRIARPPASSPLV